MSEDQGQPGPITKPLASGWVTDDRPAAKPRFFGPTAVLILLGLPLMAVLAYGTLELWSAAASDCQVFEAGSRAFVTVFMWPVSTFVLWIAYSLPILVLGRRSLRLGVIVAVVIVGVAAVLFISGTGAMIRADPDGRAFCPTGVPDWWPPILPR
jgi:hypothetical protein